VFYTEKERPLVMQRLLDKALIEDMVKQLRQKFADYKKYGEDLMNSLELTPTQKLIAELRRSSFEELGFMLGLVEATVFNVAEQYEMLTKLIQMYNGNEAQQNAIRNELIERMNSQQKELEKRHNNNDPFLQNLKKYYDKMSETTEE